MVNIGELIKSLREAKNYSQRKLGYLSGVSNATINRIENNLSVPNPQTLKKLSASLGASYIELLNAAGYLEQKEFIPGNSRFVKGNKDIAYSGCPWSGENMEGITGHEGHKGVSEKNHFEGGLEQCKFLWHIKDEELKQWIIQPENIDYLKLAKRISDLGINPEFVLNEFICKIFRNKKGKGTKI
jgi:transcriptional regulator with XRE-family HTH domain